jgi:glycosyltransferase involved in cell wall biosynthesis
LARLDPETNVRILGVGTDAENEAIRCQIYAHGLVGRVHLVRAVSADALPKELCKASVLALARAGGLFSRAGMPTRFGEYLATGRRVVVTATGDIPLYLQDEVDCYLVPPGDVQLLSGGHRSRPPRSGGCGGRSCWSETATR